MVKKKGSRDINPADAYRKEQVFSYPDVSAHTLCFPQSHNWSTSRLNSSACVLHCSERRRSRETRKKGGFSEMPTR